MPPGEFLREAFIQKRTKHYLSKLFFPFALVVMMATTSYAQADSSKAQKDSVKVEQYIIKPKDSIKAPVSLPETKSGSLAFLFTLNGLSSFGISGFPIVTFDINAGGESLRNGIINAGGGKWFFSDGMALRGLFGFRVNSKGDSDPTKQTDGSGKTSSTIWGISIGAEIHSDAVYSLSPYIGGQIIFGGASIDNQKLVTGKIVENKETISYFGVGPFLGFDWYFTRGIAIGGEYSLAYSKQSSTVTSPDVTGTASTRDDPTSSMIIINSVNVHLVVHF